MPGGADAEELRLGKVRFAGSAFLLAEGVITCADVSGRVPAVVMLLVAPGMGVDVIMLTMGVLVADKLLPHDSSPMSGYLRCTAASTRPWYLVPLARALALAAWERS
jgi:hypothetical protein